MIKVKADAKVSAKVCCTLVGIINTFNTWIVALVEVNDTINT